MRLVWGKSPLLGKAARSCPSTPREIHVHDCRAGDENKDELQEIINVPQDRGNSRKSVAASEGRAPHGPPGTGKTRSPRGRRRGHVPLRLDQRLASSSVVGVRRLTVRACSSRAEKRPLHRLHHEIDAVGRPAARPRRRHYEREQTLNRSRQWRFESNEASPRRGDQPPASSTGSSASRPLDRRIVVIA